MEKQFVKQKNTERKRRRRIAFPAAPFSLQSLIIALLAHLEERQRSRAGMCADDRADIVDEHVVDIEMLQDHCL